MKNLILQNNKGFTLIELMATVIILSVLVLYIVPNMLTYFNSSKNSLSKIQQNEIKDAAKLYYKDCENSSYIDMEGENACSEFTSGTSSYCITLTKLINLGYINKVTINKKEYKAKITLNVDANGKISTSITETTEAALSC